MSGDRATVTVVKIGGSVLTDKQRPLVFRRAQARGMAVDIRLSRHVPVIVHGTGSWAKSIGQHRRTESGTFRDATGFRMTSMRIRRLQSEVIDTLGQEGVLCCPLQANAMFHWSRGSLQLSDPDPIERLLRAGVAPLLSGDVLVQDPETFRIVSSDAVAVALARGLDVGTCVFATDVDGVWDPDGRIIPEVRRPGSTVSESDRRDVTGGMTAKVTAALDIAATGARTSIVNGTVEGRLRDALDGRDVLGTRVLSPSPRSEAVSATRSG